MAQFRPDIKPPMWGPPDAVQYAVRANAERMGVDASSLILNLPFWEGAGKALDLASGTISTNTPRWGNSFSRVDLAVDAAVFPSNPLWNFTTYTFFLKADLLPGGGLVHDNWCGLIQRNGAFSLQRYANTNQMVVVHGGEIVFTTDSGHPLFGDFRDSPSGSSLAATFDGAVSRLYLNGGFYVTSGAISTLPAHNANPYQVGRTNDNLRARGAYHYVLGVKSALNDSQIATLHAQPYALLMPVARPVFFDLGGGPPGPVPYSLTQDMLAGVSSAWVMTQDGLVQIATPWQFTQDGLASVSLAYSRDQDGTASTSSSHAATQDGTASVSTSWLIIQDGDAAVSEITGYYVTMDAVAAISEEVATTQDGSGGVSSTYALGQDVTGQISSSYLAVQDAQAQVSEGVIYTVTMDAVAQVSEVITIRQDVVVGIATSYEHLQDLAAGISSGYAIVQDGRAHVIEVDFAQMARVLKVSSGMTAISIKSAGKVRQAFKSASKLTIIQI